MTVRSNLIQMGLIGSNLRCSLPPSSARKFHFFRARAEISSEIQNYFELSWAKLGFSWASPARAFWLEPAQGQARYTLCHGTPQVLVTYPSKVGNFSPCTVWQTIACKPQVWEKVSKLFLFFLLNRPLGPGLVADSVYKLQCPSVCLCLCLCHCLGPGTAWTDNFWSKNILLKLKNPFCVVTLAIHLDLRKQSWVLAVVSWFPKKKMSVFWQTSPLCIRACQFLWETSQYFGACFFYCCFRCTDKPQKVLAWQLNSFLPVIEIQVPRRILMGKEQNI